MAANLTDERWLQIRYANVAAAWFSVDQNGMRTLVIAEVDDEPGRAELPHFLEGDFLSAPHAPNSAEESRLA